MYSLSLSLDANFRLKLKDQGIKDTHLGKGRAYYVDEDGFEEHLYNINPATEVSLVNSTHFTDLNVLCR